MDDCIPDLDVYARGCRVLDPSCINRPLGFGRRPVQVSRMTALDVGLEALVAHFGRDYTPRKKPAPPGLGSFHNLEGSRGSEKRSLSSLRDELHKRRLGRREGDSNSPKPLLKAADFEAVTPAITGIFVLAVVQTILFS